MIQKTDGTEKFVRVGNNKMEKLIKAAIKGDDKAFEEIVRLKTESIVFSALSILRQYQDAEDATQEIILRMYKSIRNLKDPKAFHAWLQRIIVNQCYDFQRDKAKKKETMSMDGEFRELLEEDKEFLPQGYAEDKEQSDFIKNLIKDLPDQRRIIVTMYYYEELSYKEIAYALEMPISSVASELRRAKETIKGELMKSKPFSEAEVNKNAAIPVVSQVLANQAYEEIPRSVIPKMVAYTQKDVIGTAAIKATGLFSWKLVATLVVCTTLISAGAVYSIANMNKGEPAGNMQSTNSAIHPNDIADLPQGNIVFASSDCECGHVNPTSITVTEIGDTYNTVDWKIINKTTNEEYVGKGTTITKEIQDFLKGEKNGDYTVIFTVGYDSGNLSLDRDFLIDSEVAPGQYS